MNRYCPNCQKEVDFSVKRMTDLDNLICPECGQKVDKYSKKPVEGNPEQVANAIGIIYYVFVRIAWVLLLVLGIAGVICYLAGLYKALFILTLVSLVYYFARYGFIREMGIVWIPVAGIAGFIITESFEGAALFINGAMIVRHIVRDVFWRLISRFINWASGR